MLRKGLVVVALLALAAPAAAQEELVWVSKRPDAQAPVGVVGGRTLEQGEVEFTYRFSQMSLAGVWYDSAPLAFEDVADFYDVVPLSLRTRTHGLGIAVGIAPDFTLSANLGWAQRRREHITSDETTYFTNDLSELADLEIAGLVKVVEQGPYRAHLQLGGLVPVGSAEAVGRTPFSGRDVHLPYDMRAGAGVFGLLPGLTALAQNESGTVGAQVKGTVFVGKNDMEYAPGDRMELNVWGSYRANAYFSVSARAAYQSWAAIDGADPDLDPFRDPGNDGLFMGGHRLDIPVGVNFYLPEGSRFAGHRLSLEYVYPASHKYDGPQLGADWGVVAAWQVVF